MAILIAQTASGSFTDMEFWRGLLDVDPVVWLFVALSVPVGLAAAWYGGFLRNG